MNKTLETGLLEMDDVDFRTLEHHMRIARIIRDTINSNGLDQNQMAEILDVEPEKMQSVLNAAYPFDLRLLSKLQMYNENTAAQKAKKEIESEAIGFAKYKDQYPMYVDDIKKLITLMNQILQPHATDGK